MKLKKLSINKMHKCVLFFFLVSSSSLVYISVAINSFNSLIISLNIFSVTTSSRDRVESRIQHFCYENIEKRLIYGYSF